MQNLNILKRPFNTLLIILLAFLSFSILNGYAQEIEYIINPILIKPSEDKMKKWVEESFTHELIRFYDEEEFYEAIDLSKIDLHTIKKIKENLIFFSNKNQKNIKNLSKAIKNYPLHHAKIGILCDENLRQMFPNSFIKAAYKLSYENEFEMPLWGSFNTQKDLEIFVIDNLIDKNNLHKVISESFYSEGLIHLAITPMNWKLFSIKKRKEMIQTDYNYSKNLSKSYEIKIKINSENILKISKKYSGERDYQSLLRFLKLKLLQQSEIVLSLEEILHPFIRKNINTFKDCDGMNCFNTSLSVNKSNHYNFNFIGTNELIKEIISQYRIVKNNENLRAGDLLLYADEFGNFVHASTYIDKEFAFTKNGYSRYSAFVFQKHETIEKEYFGKEKFQLNVFRIPENGEKVVDFENRGWLNQYNQPYFFGKLNRKLGFTAQMSLLEREENNNEVINYLKNKLFSEDEWKDILNKAEYKNNIDSLKNLYDKYSVFKNHFLIMSFLEFNPLGSVIKNNEALESLYNEKFLAGDEKKFLVTLSKFSRKDYNVILEKFEKKFFINLLVSDENGLPQENCISRMKSS